MVCDNSSAVWLGSDGLVCVTYCVLISHIKRVMKGTLVLSSGRPTTQAPSLENLACSVGRSRRGWELGGGGRPSPSAVQDLNQTPPPHRDPGHACALRCGEAGSSTLDYISHRPPRGIRLPSGGRLREVSWSSALRARGRRGFASPPAGEVWSR